MMPDFSIVWPLAQIPTTCDENIDKHEKII
jgi:hypothetical protein